MFSNLQPEKLLVAGALAGCIAAGVWVMRRYAKRLGPNGRWALLLLAMLLGGGVLGTLTEALGLTLVIGPIVGGLICVAAGRWLQGAE
jgi:hypothetical protein